MIKDNPIIKSIFIIFMFVYLMCSIYMLIAGVSLKHLVNNFIDSWIMVIGLTGCGFFVSLSIVAGTKRYKLQQILRQNGNGRYGTTQGLLPDGKPLIFDSISLKRDLPVELQQWIISSEANHPTQTVIFIKLCGILKHHINLPATANDRMSLYAHSIKVTNKLLEYSKLSADECNELLIRNKFLGPNNLKYVYFDEIKNNNLLPIIGIAHDVGKIDAAEVIAGELTYLGYHPKRARLIVSRIHAFWQLQEDLRDAIMFALGYYLEFDNRPKHYKEGGLVSTSVIGELLIHLLVCAHNEVTSFEQIVHTPVNVNNLQEVKRKIDDEIVTDDEVLLVPLVETVKLDPNNINKKITKKRNKSPENSDHRLAKASAAESRVTSQLVDNTQTKDVPIKISAMLKLQPAIDSIGQTLVTKQDSDMLLTEAFQNDK
ncbi:MAG: hypothetical protein K2Y14_01125 [Burkholderiales bacterium]|nr:hypothetical protein [Burkholderiales bacterium]